MTSFEKYFTRDEQHWLVCCNDVSEFVKALGMEYKAIEWKLLLNPSVRSEKAALLHIVVSIPIAHSLVFKESYLDIKYSLDALCYNLHQWKIRGDLKMISILHGLQGGCTKYPCFLCLRDSRADV